MRIALVAPALGLILILLGPRPALAQQSRFSATLSGANETPPNGSLATGSCSATITGASLSVTCTHTVASPTAAHVHRAAAGVAGPVISGCGFPSAVSPIAVTCALAGSDVLLLDRQGLYVNVHSSTFSGGEIRGQLVLQDEFLVNTTTTGLQDTPAVAASAQASPGFVVAFQSYEASSYDVRARRLTAAAAGLGTDAAADTTESFDQTDAAVAAAPDGSFVVVWESDQSGIFGQRFNADGSARSTEFPVNSTFPGEMHHPAAAMAQDSSFVVVWDAFAAAGTEVYARVFDAAGAPTSAHFRVNTATLGSQENPDVGMAPDGSFVVVWRHPYTGIIGQRFTAGGIPAGGEFNVSTEENYGSKPAVDMADDGSFVVAWNDAGSPGDGGGEAIQARRYAASGTPLDAAGFVVNTTTAGDQAQVAVDMDRSGDFVVTWDSPAQDGDGGTVVGQAFHSDGTPEGIEFQVNTYTTGEQARSAVALFRDGSALVVWGGTQGFDADGGIVGRRFTFPDLADPSQLSVANKTVTEGDTANKSAAFTVTLSEASAATLTVDYATSDGTAAAGSDYTAKTGTLTVTPGQTKKTVSVSVLPDLLDEANETFTVTLSNPSAGASLSDAVGKGTITDNDPAPSLAIADVTSTEGDSGTKNWVFTVTASAPSGRTVKVNYATASGSATSGTDFVAKSATLNLNPGQTAKTFAVAVNGDTEDERQEEFLVDLTIPVNATLADPQGRGVIDDNDPVPPGSPSLQVGDVAVAEGDSGNVSAVFAVTLTAAAAQTVFVDYATTAGTATAGADYTTKAGTLTFTPGQTSKNVSVTVKGDTADEFAQETFTLDLANATGAFVLDGQGTGGINDDDPAPGGSPTLSISNQTLAEGDSGTTYFTFTVSLSAAGANTVKVAYATTDVTAEAGTDYVAKTGTLSFNPGLTTKTLSVAVTGDAGTETDELFYVILSDPVNSTIADSQGDGTIMNDD